MDTLGNAFLRQVCDRRLRGTAKQSRVGISIHHDIVWPLFHQNLFNALQHLPGLGSLRTGAYTEVIVRPGDFQFTEEYLAHGVIVVLARVHQHLSCHLSQLAGYWSTLDKLRASSYN